jgi:hypothetical protein
MATTDTDLPTKQTQSPNVSRVARSLMSLDGLVFLGAAFLNWGLRVPLGVMTLAFSPRVWQAGIGEAVIGCFLLAAAATGRRTLAWVAFGLSVFGIVFGLSSRAVQGPARSVHIVLVPLACVLLVLLVIGRPRSAGGPK